MGGSRSTTLVQSDGWDALVPLVIPVVLAGVPPAFRRSRWRGVALAAASGLLLAFVVLSAASIGLFYLPVAGAMVAAAIIDGRRGGASGGLARGRALACLRFTKNSPTATGERIRQVMGAADALDPLPGRGHHLGISLG